MLIVKKYGGKTLATPEKIQRVADRIATDYKKGHRLIVTVSAMGQTTDELIRLAYQVSDKPSRREMDMLLTTGERVSMALMSMALIERGCPAISFTGSQAGVMTDSSFNQARILEVKPIRIQEELEKNRIVVLAGFQGVNPSSKEITTLGRGGTDTTAVAMGVHFKANRVEILKDVSGVFSADPKIVASAKPVKDFSYAQLLDMCFWGAQFLHFRAAVLAAQHRIPLLIGAADNDSPGTKINHEVRMFEKDSILTITSLNHVWVADFNGDDVASTLRSFHTALDQKELPKPQILTIENTSKSVRICFTAPQEIGNSVQQAVQENLKPKWNDQPLAAVAVTLNGSSGTQMDSRILLQLQTNNVTIKHVIYSTLGMAAIVPQEQKELAIRVLHDLLEVA